MSDLSDVHADSSRAESEQLKDGAQELVDRTFSGNYDTGAKTDEQLQHEIDNHGHVPSKVDRAAFFHRVPGSPNQGIDSPNRVTYSPDQSTDSPKQDIDKHDQVTYDREDAAREDLRVVVADLDKVSDHLAVLADMLRQELSEAVARQPDLEEQLDRAEQIARGVRRLKGIVTELGNRGLDQDPDLAAAAAAQAATLKGEAKNAKKRFPGTRRWRTIWEFYGMSLGSCGA